MTRAKREKLIKEWQSSGIGVMAWCESKKIPYSTFRAWQRKSEVGKEESTEKKSETKTDRQNEVKWTAVRVETKDKSEEKCVAARELKEKEQETRPQVTQRDIVKITRGNWTVVISAHRPTPQLESILKAVAACC